MKMLLKKVMTCFFIGALSKVSPQSLVESLKRSDTYDDDYYSNCMENEIQCPEEEDICYMASTKCDGHDNCPNGGDERDCPSVAPEATMATSAATTTKLQTTTVDYSACSADEFACPGDGNDPLCIPPESKCDGVFDCDNGEDESDCGFDYSTDQETTTVTPIGTTTVTTALPSSTPISTTQSRTSTDTTTKPSSSSERTTFTPRPTVKLPTCTYENQTYPADTVIVSNNCTEITCSSSGRLLTWSNPDTLTCDSNSLQSTLLLPSFALLAFVINCWLL